MHLSISNSEQAQETTPSGHIRVAIIMVIASFVAVLLVAELGARYVFPRVSKIENRIRGDEQQLMSIRRPVPGSAPTVLFLGNSLLLHGLDYPKLRSEMTPDANVFRFAIESTEFFDWYYGLHHMLAAGVRPSMVVLCLNLGQTVSSGTLGDYSARHLFGTSDLLPLAHDAGMDATRTSGLILAHWSAFYASRATVRNFVLNIADPPYARAMHNIADTTAIPLPADDVLISTARSRLDAVQKLCNQYGVPWVLLIPPATGRNNDLLARAAEQQHVNYDYPIPVGQLGREFFSDGVHLNQRGAALFTDAIARDLHARLAKVAQANEPPQHLSAGSPQ